MVGVDPSLTATGLCAVDFDEGRVLDWQCVLTKRSTKKQKVPATQDAIRRIGEVYEAVKAFLEQHPYPVAIEAQTGGSHGRAGPGATAGLMAGYAACVSACIAAGRSPTPIMPAVIKSRLGASGYQDATKGKDKAWRTANLFFSHFPDPLPSKQKREAVHDAVAVCIAALSTDLMEDDPNAKTT